MQRPPSRGRLSIVLFLWACAAITLPIWFHFEPPAWDTAVYANPAPPGPHQSTHPSRILLRPLVRPARLPAILTHFNRRRLTRTTRI